MALINLRNALMTGKRLPYDAEVEFLQSSGTQYINTGIMGASEWHITAQGAATPTTSNCVIATTSLGGSFFGNYGDMDYWAVGNGSSWRCSLPYTSIGSFIVTFSALSVQFTVNGETVTRLSAPNFSKTFYLFSTNGEGYGAKVRVYGCKVYQNGALVRDFIPVRKGTTGEMFDRVSGKFAERHGDFVLGQDVVPVEYIESHGTEYIDTGVNGSQNLRTTFDYQLVYSGTAPVAEGLFGCYTNGMKYHLYCSGAAPSAFQVGMGNAYTNTLYVDNVRHSIEFNNSAVSIDGNAVATFEPYGTPTAHTLLLFALQNASGGLYSMTPMRKWRVQMWDNGTPVRDYVPVRVGTDATSWEGAMMDVLTRRIYRNDGTGAFTYGNDLKYPIPSE